MRRVRGHLRLPSASLGPALAALGLALLPILVQQSYVLHVLRLAMIFAIAALGLQLLLGFAGQLSIGQAAFLGIGAYTSAILTTRGGAPFPIGLLAGGAAAALSSLLLAPITRLRGVYL